MLEVPRGVASSVFEDPPNTWWPVRKQNGDFIATYQCPANHCGLLDEHTIHDDGTVEPSVVCTQDNCTFHDRIKLLGWEAVVS